MTRGRLVLVVLVVAAAAAAGWVAIARDRAETRTVTAPYFEVDPFWPKPMPNHWMLGSAVGVSVDERDHVWIVHRPATLADNEKGARPQAADRGVLLGGAPRARVRRGGDARGHWGGPGQGYEWPSSGHGITVDYKGNVWIGGNGPGDAQVLKFTRDGKFLLQLGKADVHKGPNDENGQPTYTGGSNNPRNFGRAAKIFVDPKANEAYIADGYLNKRVAVVDADTGVLKRHWGAYGNKPDDANLGPYKPEAPPAQQFRNPVHCAELSNDGCSTSATASTTVCRSSSRTARS